MGVVDVGQALMGMAMRLRQVGRLQVSRILGTVSNARGNYKALIDIFERSYFMRAEINALTLILLDRGLVTDSDLSIRFENEYRALLKGFVIKDVKAFADRAMREGWPK